MTRWFPVIFTGIVGLNICCAGLIYGTGRQSLPGMSIWAILVSVLFLLGAITALLPILFPRSTTPQDAARWAIPWAFLGSSLAALVALLGVVIGVSPPTRFNRTAPLLHSIGLPSTNFSIQLDPLAAFFMLVIFGVAALVSVYSYGYLLQENNRFQSGLMVTSFNLFLLTMFLTLISNNIFWLLLLWGVMTLVSSFLVMYRHNRLLPQWQRKFLHRNQVLPPDQSTDHSRLGQLTSSRDSEMALVVYFIASHASSLLLALALLIVAWQAGGNFNLDALRHTAPALKGSAILHLVFALAFLGLGIKAGMVPFHVWLPYAHPASPANAHALMSGAMIKLSIYLMVRLFFDILGPDTIRPMWGLLVLAAGTLTAIVGVLYAVVSHELKETLAYHSIENMGIILVGLGVAFLAASQPHLWAVTSLGLAAALLHVMNHAVIKSLLFLATGAIEQVSGSTIPAQLGGLLQDNKPKRIRWIAWSFLAGAVAIAGFPPFNGFVSKWLTIQALLVQIDAEAQHITTIDSGMAVPILFGSVIAVLLLGMSFALTAYCFVKIVGQSLLGSGPRHTQPLTPRRARTSMLVALVILGVICLLLGIWSVGFSLTINTVNSVLHWPQTLLWPVQSTITIYSNSYIAWTALAGLALLLAIFGLGIALLSRRFRRADLAIPNGQTHLFEPWLYGQPRRPASGSAAPQSSTELQFTSLAFTYLIRQMFQYFYRDRASLLPNWLHRPYLNHKFILSSNPGTGQEIAVIELFRYGYNILAFNLIRFAGWVANRFQNGDLREYITYIIAVYIIVILIGVLQIW